MKATPPHRSGRDEAIEATAAAWLAQRDDGLTPQEEVEFAHWRRADPRHEEAVARLEATWHTLLQLQSFRPAARRHPDRDLLAHPRYRKVIPFSAVAAGVGLAAAVALAAVWWWPRPASRPDAEPETQHYATTAGGYQRLTLADGSLVELNASSEVNVQYTPAERRVWLVRGEANFSVAKNKERPFLVQVGPVTVRAVGTAFNVRLDVRRVEVLVTEGKVQVNNDVTAARPATAPVLEPALLVAGQRAVIAMPTATTIPAPVVEQLTAEALREELAWQDSRLVFIETPLAKVVQQFNRRNQVQIELGDPALGSLPVGGSFRAENVEAFVRLLARDQGIVVERLDSDHIILHKAR